MPLRVQKLSLVLCIALIVITAAVIIGVAVAATALHKGLGPCVDVRTDNCVGPEVQNDIAWCTEPNPNLNDSIVMINLGDFGWAKTYCTDKGNTNSPHRTSRKIDQEDSKEIRLRLHRHDGR